MKNQQRKSREKMKNNFALAARAVVTCAVLWGLAGCSAEIDDVPQTKEGKIKAIEDDPTYTPEQKATYKKQVEENERMKARLEKR
jgi:hypothetical protein